MNYVSVNINPNSSPIFCFRPLVYLQPRMDENHPENEENYHFYGWKQNAITQPPLQEKQVRQFNSLMILKCFEDCNLFFYTYLYFIQGL